MKLKAIIALAALTLIITAIDGVAVLIAGAVAIAAVSCINHHDH